MARILILLPQTDFDPTEVAVPWAAWTEAGHEVHFATETGEAASYDAVYFPGGHAPGMKPYLDSAEMLRRLGPA